MSNPLFTFFVYAYNHEMFVEEAIDGAFAQEYSPLEIILSDDCSSDKTWEIMKSKAENYKGPHKIILNRNKENLGISKHLNRIMEIGSGEWFVLGAGDDISMPDRVSTLFSAINDHPEALSASTSLLVIDSNGNETGCQTFGQNLPYVTGASGAWHRKCFDFFGKIEHPTTAEDVVIPFRSALLGGLLLIQKPTVKYRCHDNSISSPRNLNILQSWQHLLKIKYQLINACRQRLADLEKAENFIAAEAYKHLRQKHFDLISGFEKDIQNIDLRCKVYEAGFPEKLNYLIGADKSYPGKHSAFFYRLKTVLISYKLFQMISKKRLNKKSKNRTAQQSPIRMITINDMVNPYVGLLIYL